ncbi:MAG: hypothetical protein JWR90_2669 [Marmoricola sp.]|jgi:uncharacterized membrane protein YphA (DoxX/SURF4 family)|nr:hypothetical protein [Marmoricola sp.]
MKLRNVPTRLATGAFILHSGIEKWSGSPEQAAGVHGMAAGAFPVLKGLKPTEFLKALSIGEVAVGTALLAPVVPPAVAGAALTGFSGALVTMYLRTDALHKPGSIWPTQAGTGVSKDVWMLGIGVGLLVDALTRREPASGE